MYFIERMLRYLARTYMTMLDCVAPTRNRRREAQEEILADLNTCSDQLQQRLGHMELRITRCTESAMVHARLAKKAPAAARGRELTRAKMFMQDRRRLQAEHEKGLRMSHLLQMQVDSIMSSHMDMMLVQTMRSYNSTATMLSMPNLTAQIEKLSDNLADRSHELQSLQDALNTISTSMTIDPGMLMMGEDDNGGDELQHHQHQGLSEDEGLMRELEQLLRSTDDEDEPEVVAVVTLPSPPPANPKPPPPPPTDNDAEQPPLAAPEAQQHQPVAAA